jgi:hypothetical protein
MTISQGAREFFIELGSRIAQVPPAETFGVSQPAMNACALGQRRGPKLLQQVERLARPPRTQRRVAKRIIEGVLAQAVAR